MPKKKEEDSAAPSIPQKRVEFKRPDAGVPAIYANHIQLRQTVFDLAIVFGEVTDISEERVEVTQRVQTTLSWLEAKALAQFLDVFIKNFEQLNGPIATEFKLMTLPKLPVIPNIK